MKKTIKTDEETRTDEKDKKKGKKYKKIDEN
jgi:hypothetical protein